jgi:hypothetical protein
MDKPTIMAATAGGTTSLLLALLNKKTVGVAIAQSLTSVLLALFVAPSVCTHYGWTDTKRDAMVYVFGVVGYFLVSAASKIGKKIEDRSEGLADDAISLSWRRVRRLMGRRTQDEPADK